MNEQKAIPSEQYEMVHNQMISEPDDFNPQTVKINANGTNNYQQNEGANIELLQSPIIINPLFPEQVVLIPVNIQPMQQVVEKDPFYFPELNITNQFKFEPFLIVEKKCLEKKTESKFFIPSLGEVHPPFFRSFFDNRDWPYYEINFSNEISQYERLLIMEQHFSTRVY